MVELEHEKNSIRHWRLRQDYKVRLFAHFSFFTFTISLFYKDNHNPNLLVYQYQCD